MINKWASYGVCYPKVFQVSVTEINTSLFPPFGFFYDWYGIKILVRMSSRAFTPVKRREFFRTVEKNIIKLVSRPQIREVRQKIQH